MRLNEIHATDDWFHAMRAYPRGVPLGAREIALTDAASIESKRVQPRATPALLAATTGTWFPLGPTPDADGPTYGPVANTTVPSAGRATKIAANPANPGEVWLGTATGGVWHTANALTTDPNWTPVDGLQFPDSLGVTGGGMAMSIGALAVDGCTATGCARVWIGTGEDGIRRDTYYGAGLFLLAGSTLTQAADFRYGSVVRIAIPPHAAGTSDTVYAAVSSGVTSPSTEATVTAPAPAGGYGIYKTNNGGSSFFKLPIPGVENSLPTDIEIDPSDGTTLLAGFMSRDPYALSGAVRGILRAGGGGEFATDWCSLNDNTPLVFTCPAASGLPPGGTSVFLDHPITGTNEILGYATIRFSPNVPGRVYAAFGQCGQRADFGCVGPAVYRSDTNGFAWQNLEISGGADPGPASPVYQYGRYTHALTIVPGLGDAFVVGGTEIGLCGSAGGTCSLLGNVLSQTHPDHHDIVFPFPNGQVIYDANDGGFFFSLDAGTTWTSGNTTLTTSQFDSLAVYGQNLFGGLQDNGMAYFNGTRVWRGGTPIGDGGQALVYAYGSPPTPVWIFTPAQSPPWRSVGDPSILGNTTNLQTQLPLSAQLQANGEQSPTGDFIPAQSAFFPPIALNGATNDIYFATTQVYKSTDTDDVRGDTWTTISPLLATPQGGLFSTLDTDNVITALGVGTDGTVYVGTYIGEVWSSPAPCADASCWVKVLGPEFGQNLPISSIVVQPGNSVIAYVTLSGFGTASHVLSTHNRGTTWDLMSAGLVDVPANVIRFDSVGNLWLGTDIGIYEFDGATWTRSQSLPFVAVTDIAAWQDPNGEQRLYAATHGRGAWVLTQPTVTTLEGWTMGSLRDLPIYGYGFPNTTGAPVICTTSLIQQSGTVCATGGIDATGGIIEVDAAGQLQSTRPSFWDNKPVVWACAAGTCLNGVPEATCNQDSSGNPDPLSSVEVSCVSAGTGFAHVMGAPTLGNPPASSLLLDPPADVPVGFVDPPTWSFDVVVSRTTATGATSLCRAPMTVPAGTSDDAMASAAVIAVNATPSCLSAGVTAILNVPPPGAGEDGEIAVSSTVGVAAPGTGSQVFVTFRSAPGAAAGVLFDLLGLGNVTLRQGAVMRTVFETGPSGAAG